MRMRKRSRNRAGAVGAKGSCKSTLAFGRPFVERGSVERRGMFDAGTLYARTLYALPLIAGDFHRGIALTYEHEPH
jgi:hypothetical protein